MNGPITNYSDGILFKDEHIIKITGRTIISGKTHYLIWPRGLEGLVDHGFWHPFDHLDAPEAIEKYHSSPRARRTGGEPFDRHFLLRIN